MTVILISDVVKLEYRDIYRMLPLTDITSQLLLY
jgi:hypothetical protein